jgi:hypothetical protein
MAAVPYPVRAGYYSEGISYLAKIRKTTKAEDKTRQKTKAKRKTGQEKSY